MKKTRKGVAAIIFFDDDGKRKYLLFRRKMHWKGWEWMKGGTKKCESELASLKREIKEETGKQMGEYNIKRTNKYHSFDYEMPFVYDKHVWNSSKNKVFLIEFFDKTVKIGKIEHSGYEWLNKKDALKKITWPDQQRIFKRLAF
jgi:8-oxo-dGTP pyrophosphatase MutT (NUDIX family)